MTTPKLQMPELVVGQAGKELTHNQALAVLDQLAQAVVVDKDLASPPGSPANGSMYIVAAGATGAWAGQGGKLAYWLTTVAAWTFITPADGWSVWVADEDVRYERKAGVWVVVSSGGGAVYSVNGKVGAVLLPQPTLLINGDFSINQRGFAGGALAAGSYGHDRWGAYNGGANYSVSAGVITLVSGVICQVIESPNLASTAVTVSLEDPSGTVTVTIGNSTGSSSATGTITSGAGRRGVTLTVPAAITGDLKIRLSGTAVSFKLVKVELGPAITPWAAPGRSDEIQRSSRFFRAIANGSSGNAAVILAQGVTSGAAGIAVCPMIYPVPMRAAPAVTVSGVTFSRSDGTLYTPDATLNAFTSMGPSNGKINLELTTGAEGGVPNPTLAVLRTATSYIHLDAELPCTD